MRRPLFAISIFLLSSVCASAQMRSNLPVSVDPFSLKPGSSFSASGGGGGELRRQPVSSKTAQIAGDLSEAEAIIRDNYIDRRSAKGAELTKNALEGALRSLDPHSNFYDAREWKDLLDEEQSGYSGIGATIGNFERGGGTETYVLATFPGSPAAKAGLRYGDKILQIDGETVSGKPSEEVRDKIRGADRSLMRMTIERASDLQTVSIQIRRGIVPQPSIPDAYIVRPGVGYVELSEGFNYTTYAELDAAIRELKKQGMRTLVLDLRGNGGGIVDQAVKVAERFLPSGTLILTQKGRSRSDNRVWRSSNATAETMPLVVLVDQDTASASEILTGALQDNDRAIVVGERTFGKGLVQSVIDLPFKTGLTLTTARYLTPAGRSIQRDYSSGDTYDYFNHTQQASAIDVPQFAARTVTGRTVFGGDGIQPDETIAGSKTTNVEAALQDPIFFFVRALVNDRVPVSAYRPASFASGAAEGNLASAAFAAFVRSDASWSTAARSLKTEENYIGLRLRYYLALATDGTKAAEHLLIDSDPQMARAINALPRAGDLSRLAARSKSK